MKLQSNCCNVEFLPVKNVAGDRLYELCSECGEIQRFNKLQLFVYRLANAGLSEKQIDEVVSALNDYNVARFDNDTKQSDMIDTDQP